MTEVLDGRVVLITGGNAGIGKETAVALASMGAQVVFTARDAARGTEALAEIRTRSGNDAVDVMPLDLARFASVREFAKRWSDEHDQLDVLVNNAGLILNSRRETDDGNEMTFQVNHLGPFLLTQLLRDQLVAGDDARVVNVASDAHSSARRVSTSTTCSRGGTTGASASTARPSSPTSCSRASWPGAGTTPASPPTRCIPGSWPAASVATAIPAGSAHCCSPC